MKLLDNPLSSLTQTQRETVDALIAEKALAMATRAEWVRERAFALVGSIQTPVERALKTAKDIYDGSYEK